MNIANPEDLKDILTKIEDFPKLKSNPYVKLLVTGTAHYEGEKWRRHRRIINPAFQLDKLKVFIYTLDPASIHTKFVEILHYLISLVFMCVSNIYYQFIKRRLATQLVKRSYT